MVLSKQKREKLLASWREAWPKALECWSRYTRLSEPRWCFTARDLKREGLTGSFAKIRFSDHGIVIGFEKIVEYELEDYAEEILAHEIGHHVFCPGDLIDNARALAQTRLGLPSLEAQAPQILNMYEDLLINDRLFRFHGHRHDQIYQRIAKANSAEPSPLWGLYMGAFEVLWGLERGSLGGGKLKGAADGDARLAARLVRVYGKDWIRGAGGFAALCFPYLLKEKKKSLSSPRLRVLLDSVRSGVGSEIPMGLVDEEGMEIVHPSLDPAVVGDSFRPGEDKARQTEGENNATSGSDGGGPGQCREPFEYGQILKALGIELSDHDLAVKYYRERAIPHLVPFPSQAAPVSTEPLMEGLEPWDVGSPWELVDWFQSVMISPNIVPGLTTVRRSWGVMQGRERDPEPLDLDLYVDCSGSIPNPQRQLSYLTLAGAIVVLSALRAGSRVQATLWSGARQFEMTPDFVRDETQILRVLTGYFGGGTAFPNHIFRETYQDRQEHERPVHILVLSDDGIDTMARPDEKGNPGMEIAKMALDRAGGGGSMVLNLWNEKSLEKPYFKQCFDMGWSISLVKDWSGLVEFAREFSRLKFGESP